MRNRIISLLIILASCLMLTAGFCIVAEATESREDLTERVNQINEYLNGLINSKNRGEEAEKTKGVDESTDEPLELSRMNEETGYAAVIIDTAGLLSAEETGEVLDTMYQATAFCNVICFTNQAEYQGSEIQYGGHYMEQICRDMNLDEYTAVLFMVDMFNRKIAICPSKNVYSVITSDISNTITDNIYTYASKGDYARVIKEAFLQIFRVFDGQAIAQPMRYITAALLAIFAGLGISLILVRVKTKRNLARYAELTNALEVNECEPNINVTLVKTRKVHHVESSGGGGGGGFSGGGGGGGGGGGFSGGGGSHSF